MDQCVNEYNNQLKNNPELIKTNQPDLNLTSTTVENDDELPSLTLRH